MPHFDYDNPRICIICLFLLAVLILGCGQDDSQEEEREILLRAEAHMRRAFDHWANGLSRGGRTALTNALESLFMLEDYGWTHKEIQQEAEDMAMRVGLLYEDDLEALYRIRNELLAFYAALLDSIPIE